jgi:hypothetical protein
MELLAITLLGFTFSGTLALIVGIVVVVVVVGAWLLLARRSR